MSTLVGRVGLYMGGLLIAIALVIVGVVRFTIVPALDRSGATTTLWILDKTVEDGDDRGQLHDALADVGEHIHARITAFDAGGVVLASTGEPLPWPSFDAETLAREGRLDLPRGGVLLPFRRGRAAFCALRPQPPPLALSYVATALALVLGAVATASFLLVRSMASPLSRLARAARSFGAGDLGARAPADRRDEIGDVARAFNEMAARIGALRRGEKELLANVSHELRTPLARIRVIVELAEDEEPKAARAYLQEIVEDLTEIERMIDDIIAVARLDFAEADAGSAYPALRVETTHVEELVRAVVQRLGATTSGVALEIDADAPRTIACDATLVRRVIANLLQNAASHGGGSAIEVHVGRAVEGVAIVVRDHGSGIAAADVARVFDAFFRADASRTRATGGVGLGLTLSKRIVDAHGGSIALSSELGRGTEVRVVLPGRPRRIGEAPAEGQ